MKIQRNYEAKEEREDEGCRGVAEALLLSTSLHCHLLFACTLLSLSAGLTGSQSLQAFAPVMTRFSL